MASFGFAPNTPSEFWGGSSWSGLGGAIKYGTDVGFDYLNNLYNLQNRVALDRYAVPAAAAGLEAERNQSWRNQLESLGEVDAYMRALRALPAQVQQPGMTQAGGESSQAMQTGDPRILDQVTSQAAHNAVFPSFGTVRNDMMSVNPNYVPLIQQLGLSRGY